MKEFFRRALALIPKSTQFRLFRFYPPFLGAGVRITHVSSDLRAFTVQMPLRVWNRNYVGTHFGGSLYSLADPWFMLILMENLGSQYVVWDKAASIRFRKPGRDTVSAHFEISQERIEAIRAEADRDGKAEPIFSVQVMSASGEEIASIEKTVYVRRL